MSIYPYIKRHRFMASAIIIIIIVAIFFTIRATSSKTAPLTNNGPKKVQLINVATFRQGYLNVPADGIVESSSEADLRSQVSAPVSSINVSIGDTVYAGSIILELENADTRAQLSQAQASLAIAKGLFSNGNISLGSAQSSAIDKVRDAYVKGYDTVVSQIDPLLNNYDGNGSRLASFVTDYKLGNSILDNRIDLVTSLREWKIAVDTLTTSSTLSEINSAISLSQKNISSIDRLLGDISEVLNNSSKSATTDFSAFLNRWKTIVSVARATISGATQSLTGAQSALASAGSAQGSTAPAQVALAEAGVSNLNAQLAKTIIRSPIAGRIAALPLRVGELASPGTLLTSVVGEGGLVIKAYASSEDSPRIKVGAAATIRSNSKGIVESISPSLSYSNKKVEVIIKVLDPESSGLIVGDSIQVSIATQNTLANAPTTTTNISVQSSYILPIQDVKIIPGSAFVFTVDENSKIERNDIILGEVRGDFIEVKSGLNDSMNIVAPVYELDEGQVVSTQ